MIRKLFSGILAQREADRNSEINRDLIRREAKIGGRLFGPIPSGNRREFFCLDEHTWVWHEEWTDENGQRRMKNTRYDVRPSGIVKSSNGHYKEVKSEEAHDLLEAARLYQQQVKAQLYSAV